MLEVKNEIFQIKHSKRRSLFLLDLHDERNFSLSLNSILSNLMYASSGHSSTFLLSVHIIFVFYNESHRGGKKKEREEGEELQTYLLCVL